MTHERLWVRAEGGRGKEREGGREGLERGIRWEVGRVQCSEGVEGVGAWLGAYVGGEGGRGWRGV